MVISFAADISSIVGAFATGLALGLGWWASNIIVSKLGGLL